MDTRQRHQEALLDLAAASCEDFEEALRRILKRDADTLGVERVSYWSFRDERLRLRCESMYRRTEGTYERGLELEGADFPRYFSALDENPVIVANDALEDARTSEFTKSYLKPNRITAMMDAPVWIRGVLAGVVCHEHVGGPRTWTAEEQDFALAVANMVAVALEASGRRKAEQALHEQESRFHALAEAVEAARVAIRAREELVALVSHDLRNPISIIQMNASLLLLDLPPNASPSMRRRADAIVRSAKWMSRLIHDVLDSSRLESGALSLQRTDEDLDRLVTEAVELLRPLAVDKGITLDVQLGAAGHRVHVDRARMLQVLSNLLDNAIKFTPPAGRIVVRTELEDGHVIARVSDTGPGIKLEDQAHVFRRYWRAQDDHDHHGAGLGLYLARGLIKAHGGVIGVQSTPGAGATFYFTLPAKRAEDR